MLARIGVVELEPVLARVLAALADAVGEVLQHAVWDEELGVLGPAVVALRGADLVLAERFAVRSARVLLGGGAPADVTVDDDERGPLVLLLERLEGAGEHLEVVRVADARDVPAIGDEARGDVLGERESRVPLDRDLVVVVDPAEVRELEMPGQRGGFAGDAFHHVAVAAERVDVVVEELVPRLVEVGGLPEARDRHPDRSRDAGAQRASSRLDPRGPPVLGMSRALRVELAEPLQVVERDRELAEGLVGGIDCLDGAQVEEGVEERRGVTHRVHVAVPVRPDRVVRIEAQEPLPERVGHGRHRHRRPRMARVRRLDGVDRQRPDRVDRQDV